MRRLDLLAKFDGPIGGQLVTKLMPCLLAFLVLSAAIGDARAQTVGDPKAGACGGAFNLFELPGLNHRCEITPGVMAAESLGLLREFFRERRAEG